MNKTTKFHLCLDIVEDMVARKGHHSNTCMILELRELMENYVTLVLLRGQTISLRQAFQHSWNELTDQDTIEMEDSFLIVE